MRQFEVEPQNSDEKKMSMEQELSLIKAQSEHKPSSSAIDWKSAVKMEEVSEESAKESSNQSSCNDPVLDIDENSEFEDNCSQRPKLSMHKNSIFDQSSQRPYEYEGAEVNIVKDETQILAELETTGVFKMRDKVKYYILNQV